MYRFTSHNCITKVNKQVEGIYKVVKILRKFKSCETREVAYMPIYLSQPFLLYVHKSCTFGEVNALLEYLCWQLFLIE